MKLLNRHYWAISLLALAFAEAQTTNNDLTPAISPPVADAIIIMSKGKDWSVDQLNRTALQFLWSNGSMPKGLKIQTIIHVLPDDKITMCEILYVQDFGQPYWRVKLGYDGKIQTFTKRMKKEG